MPTYIRGCDAKSERSVDQSWISLTKDRSRVPLLPRPDAPSEITALPEPYMLTIQGGGRSIEMPVDARGGKANKRTNSSARITARQVPGASPRRRWQRALTAECVLGTPAHGPAKRRSEEHTSELQSLRHLVCRLL